MEVSPPQVPLVTTGSAASGVGPGGSGRLRPAGSGLFPVAFGLYLAGLLVWLALGAVPSVASALPALRDWLSQVSAGHGTWAHVAARIVDRRALLAHGPAVVVQYLFSLLNLALGLLLVVRRVHDVVARLLVFALLGTAATFNEPSHQVFHVIGHVPVVTVLHFTFHVVSGVTYLWAVVLYPDGRLPPGLPASHRVLRATVVIVSAEVVIICWRSSFISHPPFFVVFFGVLIPLFGIAAQTLRMRRPGAPERRQQARLLRGAVVPAFITALVWMGTWVVGQSTSSLATGAQHLDHRLESVFPAVFAVVPVMLFVGVLRYRLWDIDTVVSRTMLYASLAGFISLAYVVTVTVIGWLLGAGAWSAVVALAVVGLAIDPARLALKSATNRVVFGQALSPAEAMRSLARGLERLAPAEEMVELARVVVEGTRAVSAGVWLVVDDQLMSMAQWPQSSQSMGAVDWCPLPGGHLAGEESSVVGADRCVPIYYQDTMLGVLALTLPAGVRLPSGEERLVADLAGHAGLLVHNAQLTAQLAQHVERLAAQATELRQSRQRLVDAQDAERRRLERDIHDGAQQELVAVLVSIRTMQSMSGAALIDELSDVRSMLVSTGATLRDLCVGTVPGGLVDGGVAGALRAVVATAERSGLAVTVSTDLPRRPPIDVEAAVYFCSVEALQNAAKHARAHVVEIRVAMAGAALEFEISDDGVGFDPATIGRRSGLTNMSERLSILGGMVAIESRPGGGTTVRGTIPEAAMAVDRPLQGAAERA